MTISIGFALPAATGAVVRVQTPSSSFCIGTRVPARGRRTSLAFGSRKRNVTVLSEWTSGELTGGTAWGGWAITARPHHIKPSKAGFITAHLTACFERVLESLQPSRVGATWALNSISRVPTRGEKMISQF